MKNYELQAFLQFDDGSTGNAAANQTFNVTIARGGSGDATIYQDADGTTELTRPFQTDQYGRFKFYAANGYYNILFDDPEVANLNNLLDRDIFEPQEIPSDTKLYAMTKVEFDALAEQRKRVNAGSGFLEWGKHFPNSVNFVNINEGMTATVTASNANNKNLFIGRNFSDAIGSSRTNYPKALVNGVVITLADIVGSNAVSVGIQNAIPFPPAPDGTKTYNSATGVVVQHANVATAFAAETATNKVITSRKDLVFLESWHEAIEDKDQVYWLGNVQQGADNPYGAPNLTRSDGYTRFGEWDTTTTGKYSTWSALSDAQKLAFIQDPENNIYYDSKVGKFIQVRYRVRVNGGFGDEWKKVRCGSDGASAINYTENTSNGYLWAQGAQTTAPTYGVGNGNTFFLAKNNNYPLKSPDYGLAYSPLQKTVYMPIALVQRLNQGAYHPTYNTQGCARFSDNNFWYNTTDTAASTQDCFELALNGDIASVITGRSDQYNHYDAIYAGLVEDLRLNANKQDYARLAQDRLKKAIAGTVRGKERLPFTKVFASVAAVEAGYTIVNQDNPAAVVAQSYSVLTAEYDELPWVDIVGNPTSIAATFPDGIVGQWIPVSVVGGNSNFNLNRKANASESFWVQTSNSGANFSVGTKTIGQATNTVNFTLITTSVLLIHYEALSNHTKASNRDAVEYANFDTLASSSYLVNNGNRLAGSTVGVIGKVNNENENQGAKINAVQDRLDVTFKLSSVKHSSIDSTPNAGAGTKGIKSTPYLVQKGGLLYVQYLSQELEHDGTDWGDSGFIQIVDGDVTYINDNGVTLKASCHTDIIPIAIADYTETSK